MENKIINCLFFTVRLIDLEGHLVMSFPPDKKIIPTIQNTWSHDETIDGKLVPICSYYKYVKGLPVEESGIYYIVDKEVKHLFPDRADLLILCGKLGYINGDITCTKFEC